MLMYCQDMEAAIVDLFLIMQVAMIFKLALGQ